MAQKNCLDIYYTSNFEKKFFGRLVGLLVSVPLRTFTSFHYLSTHFIPQNFYKNLFIHCELYKTNSSIYKNRRRDFHLLSYSTNFKKKGNYFPFFSSFGASLTTWKPIARPAKRCVRLFHSSLASHDST